MSTPTGVGRSFVGEDRLETLRISLEHGTSNLASSASRLSRDASDLSQLSQQVFHHLKATDDELAKFTERLDDARGEISTLKHENGRLRDGISALESVNRGLRIDVDELWHLKGENEELRREFEVLRTGVRDSMRGAEGRNDRSRRTSGVGERRP